jgi:F0F1-type ATP synthase assembly protein I
MIFLPNKAETPENRRKYGNALSLGTNMAAGMAVFTFLGYHGGKRMGAIKLGTAIGMFLGLIYGGYETWKIVRQLQSEEDAPDGDAPEDESMSRDE